jgi:hypothetical protein
MKPRTTTAVTVFVAIGLLVGTVSPGAAQGRPEPVEPRAGQWKTWVLTSGKDLQLPPPPDAQATAAELQELKRQAGQRDAAAVQRIRYWDFWSPSYRWHEMYTDAAIPTNLGVPGIRATAMLHVALADAMVAAWDSKYAYNRPRPAEADPGFATAVPTPRSPTYPCEQSVAAGAGSVVLAHLFPKDAARFTEAAEEAARSRVLAGVVYPSDARAGLELGRAVGARVIEHMKPDGQKWAGTIPTGPGLWRGTDPIGIDEVRWTRFVLSSPSQFRPGPPPAADSAERATQVAEVKNYKRTPVTNGKASYWQFGQYGTAGITYRAGDEIGRQLAQAGLDRNPPRAARAYALVYVAHYEAYIASQDSKFHYWTARPNQFDPSITTVVPNPPFPSYPSNAAALGATVELMLSHLFPQETARYASWAKEFADSRLWAGIHFKSDLEAGDAIGRAVAGKVIERATTDGAQ